MAKQKGLFPLRGKLGDHSFYQTAGVPSTIVRKINEGLSERVKNNAEYANTRLNNDEFRRANAIAKALYDSVQPAWRTMFRRFALAEMTKSLLEDIRKDNAPWGKRTLDTELYLIGPEVLETRAKAGVYDGRYGTFTFDENPEVSHGVELNCDISAATMAQWASQGFDGIMIQANLALIATQEPDDSKKTGTIAYYNKAWWTEEVPVGSSSVQVYSDAVVNGALFGINEVLFSAMRLFKTIGCVCSVSLMPYITIGTVKNILQEACTYTSLAVDVKALYN